MLTFAQQNQQGALAHLARAFDWQSRGGEFESRMLHKSTKGVCQNDAPSCYIHKAPTFTSWGFDIS